MYCVCIVIIYQFFMFIVDCNHSLESSSLLIRVALTYLLLRVTLCLMSHGLRLPIGAFGFNLHSNLTSPLSSHAPL